MIHNEAELEMIAYMRSTGMDVEEGVNIVSKQNSIFYNDSGEWYVAVWGLDPTTKTQVIVLHHAPDYIKGAEALCYALVDLGESEYLTNNGIDLSEDGEDATGSRTLN